MKEFEWTSRDGESLLTLNSSTSVYVVSDLKGFSDPPEFNQVVQTAPYQHGSTPMRAFARPRTVTFKLLMVGATLANLEATRRFVGRVFSGLSAQGLPNEGTLRVTAEDAVSYSILAVPTGVDYQIGVPGRGPRHQRANLYLTAYDPWWRVLPVNQEALADATPIVITNLSDIPVWPEWTITGASISPKLENLDTGQVIEFDQTLAALYRLEVGHRFGRKFAQAVEIADDTNITNWMPYLTSASVWWKLGVGSNNVEFTSGGGGAGTLSWYTELQTIAL